MPRTELSVKLVGEDGNIFSLIGIVAITLKQHGYKTLAEELQTEIMSNAGSYEEALQIIADYVEIS